jgi:hypothetical protein
VPARPAGGDENFHKLYSNSLNKMEEDVRFGFRFVIPIIPSNLFESLVVKWSPV